MESPAPLCFPPSAQQTLWQRQTHASPLAMNCELCVYSIAALSRSSFTPIQFLPTTPVSYTQMKLVVDLKSDLDSIPYMPIDLLLALHSGTSYFDYRVILCADVAATVNHTLECFMNLVAACVLQWFS